MTSDLVLSIVLIVLVLAGIWAVIEVALTVRSARRDIDSLTTSAREVIEEAQPVIAKLDGVVDELEPAAKHLPPLLEQTEQAVGEASDSLAKLGTILDDVSSVSGAASSVSGAVNKVAETAASSVAGVVSRLRGTDPGEEASALPEAQQSREQAVQERAAREREVPQETRYVDYGDVSAAPAGSAAASAPAGADAPAANPTTTKETD